MKKLLFLLLLPLSMAAQTTVTKVINGGPGVGNFNWVVYTPPGITTDTVGLLMIPGSGESGSDPTKAFVNGPDYWLKANPAWKPGMVVAFAQTPVTWGPNRGDNPYFIKAAIKELLNGGYHVDKKRFILTGLSYGAGYIFEYIQYCSDSEYIQPAGVVAMSMSIFGINGNYNAGTDALAGTDFRWAKIPAWFFCGNTDPFLQGMQRYIALQAAVGTNIKFTLYTGGHCCWNTQYDPSNTAVNLYPWIMKQGTATVPVVPVVPTLKARLWIDSLTVHYPNTSVLLADSSKNAYYTTLQVSNSVAAAFPTRFSPMSDGRVLLANLTDGSYIISLIAADSLKHYDTAAVKIRVYGPPGCPVCPICPPPRKATGFTIDAVTGKYSFTYDDGNP